MWPEGRKYFGLGYVGVGFFFVLSGFVLTWATSPRSEQSQLLLAALRTHLPDALGDGNHRGATFWLRTGSGLDQQRSACAGLAPG